MFERWGRFVYRFRWATLVGSLVMLALSIAAILAGGNFNADRPTTTMESDRAGALIKAELPQVSGSGSSFLLLFSSPDLKVADPQYRSALENAVAPLLTDQRVKSVVTPYGASSAGLISRDGRQAVVVVNVKDSSRIATGYVRDLRSRIKPGPLQIVLTGNVPINNAFDRTLEADLQRAELVSLPIALLLLVFIFRSAVAALLPVGVALLTIGGGVAATLVLSYFTYVSQYAFNIVTLVGLGVSIDYSLMFVSRFREELVAGKSREDAVARAMATAGRAITFSGLAVAVGLSSLLFFQGTLFASMGIAGAAVVGLAVLYALTLLPALLAVMGAGVNRLRLPWQRAATARGFWHTTATRVMRRPVLVLVACLAILVTAGTPFIHLRLAGSGVDALPPSNEARQGYDTLVRDFAGYDNNEIPVVAYFPNGSPTSAGGAATVAALRQQLASIPGVVRVDEAVTGTHIALLNVVSNLDPSTDGARGIVTTIRAHNTLAGGGQVLVDGQTAGDLDIIAFIKARLLVAAAFVLLVTYVVLFLMTRSVVLPLKAVITNLLSISASFGALVWIFQQGHLASVLHFTPQSIDPTVPVILFALVFGLSMDYEVLLLARIQEVWRRTGDNTRAVAEGLELSGRLITGAAAIMVTTFLGFGLADVVLIKSIGIGIAVAIAVDATLVRALLVPAVMRLLGTRNWWAPQALIRMRGQAGAGELESNPEAA
ncbi:MAG TPA: MMPL family transporter [Candidatus Dormibacteraeota bacterium]|nr:MMPL family transporter [Candidatus Dormibacteraeota bacterium]